MERRKRPRRKKPDFKLSSLVKGAEMGKIGKLSDRLKGRENARTRGNGKKMGLLRDMVKNAQSGAAIRRKRRPHLKPGPTGPKRKRPGGSKRPPKVGGGRRKKLLPTLEKMRPMGPRKLQPLMPVKEMPLRKKFGSTMRKRLK